TSVRPREQPIGLVAAGPCCRGKERSHCISGTRSGEDASEEIPARAEERNEPSLVNGPGIVAGAAIERRLRKRTRATSPRKKRRHIVSVHLQASAQVARPRLVVRNRQHAAQPPLSGVLGVSGNLSRLQDHQVLVVDKKIQDRQFVLPYRGLAHSKRWGSRR